MAEYAIPNNLVFERFMFLHNKVEKWVKSLKSLDFTLFFSTIFNTIQVLHEELQKPYIVDKITEFWIKQEETHVFVLQTKVIEKQ